MERREALLKGIWLAESIGPASRLGVALLRYFETVEDIYRQKPEDTVKWDFLTKKEQGQMARILSQKRLDGAERILRRCEELHIQITVFQDRQYPSSLRSLPTAPMALYYKGNLPMLDRRFTIAVVGTRSMSDYGRHMAYRMGYGLTIGGGLIVSGMALGVDTVAMMGALDAGGTVIGVLGSGVDVIYPREHRQAYYRILDRGGCILSEYPPGTEPRGYHFPVRNRIISGLSDAGVVVEGDAKSGSLITARNLIYQGRKLFAVPGQIGLPGSEGPNMLIRNGALPALEPEDVLEEFLYLFPDSLRTDVVRQARELLDMDAASRQSMQSSGVGTRSQKNYVGEGTYGGKSLAGKRAENPAATPQPVMPTAPAPETQEAEAEELLFPQWMKDMAAQIMQEYASGKPFFSMGREENKKRKKKNASPPSKEDQSPTPDRQTLALEKKPAKTAPAAEPAKEESRRLSVDTSLLEEGDMRLYNRMKPNVPVTPDELVADGVTMSEILTALTTLEMAGVVEAGSGGYFLRTDPDDFPVSLVDSGELAEKE